MKVAEGDAEKEPLNPAMMVKASATHLKGERMTWEEYQRIVGGAERPTFENREPTDIECPECRRKIWRRTDIVLTSNPPKQLYECACGWSGTA